MAGKWQGFDEDAMLQFDAVRDGRTTELCARLHGTTLPKSHSFWKTYYPPNHFNCRSTVRQVYGRAATKENDVPSADIPKMFQTNLGDDGLIFPENHAYFIGLPDNVNTTTALRTSMRELANKRVVGKIIAVNDIGDVHITKSGIRKCLTQSTPPEFYDKKNLLIPFANSLLENAYDIKLSANKYNPLLKVWHTKVKGLAYFRLVIKEEVHDGTIINVLYSITAKK